MIKLDKTNKWLWLKLCAKLSARKGMQLFDALGCIDAIYEASYADLCEFEFLRKSDVEKLLNKSTDGIEQYRHALDTNNVHVITPDSHFYPELLRHGDHPPYVLFARGKLLDLNRYLCIGVVGTRNPTVYGQRATDSLSYGLAQSGGIIVSGMALGVDAIAHRAALRAGMPTVAVLGCGVNITYPKSHYELSTEIAKTGMIISEYPLSAPAERYNFPERNRIIAGLCHALAVTEADVKSGSLITADFALKANRDVFSVPGNIDSDTSKGTNHLIKQGAFPLTEASDIIGDFYDVNSDLVENSLRDFVAGKSIEEDNPVEYQISDEPENNDNINPVKCVDEGVGNEEKIIAAVTAKALTMDQISYATGISLAELNVLVLMLEVGGKIRKTNGIYYTAV